MAKYALLIGGKSFAASAYSVVRNPSTGEAVGEMPLASKADLEAAVSAAKLAFQTWQTHQTANVQTHAARWLP